MAASRRLVLLLAILTAPAALAQSEAVVPFAGTYEGGSPLQSLGDVSLAPSANHSLGWNATRPHVLARELLFRAERADFEVTDRPRAYGFGGHSVLPGITGDGLHPGASPGRHLKDAQHVEVHLELDVGSLQVQGLQGAPDRQAAYGQRLDLAEATCQWRPTPLLKDGGLVAGRCQAKALEGKGASLLRVNRGLVELGYTDPETGDRKSLSLRLGPYIDPDPTVPGLERRGTRSLLLVPRHPSAQAFLQAPVDLNITGPSLLVEGTLRIPAGQGSYRWDETVLKDPQTELGPVGGFMLASPDGSRLSLNGRALNGPAAAYGPGASAFTAVSLAAAAAIAGSLLLWRLASGLLALFSRVQQPRALDHPQRRDIIEFLLTTPGARLSDLRRKLQISRPAARYHITVLLRVGIVRREGRASGTRYWPRAASPRAAVAAHASQDPVLAEILSVLRREPGAPQRRLALAVGLTQPRVSRALRRLAQLGLVEASGTGRRRAYRPAMPNGAETDSGLTP